MYATFIQSTPDHVVNSALKIVTGEMWSSAAGESSHRLTEGMALFEGAIYRRQYFSAGHGHPLGVGLHLLQATHYTLFFHATPYIVYSALVSGICISALKQATRFGPANPSLCCSPEKDGTLS
jgi:hypothetical protein